LHFSHIEQISEKTSFFQYFLIVFLPIHIEIYMSQMKILNNALENFLKTIESYLISLEQIRYICL